MSKHIVHDKRPGFIYSLVDPRNNRTIYVGKSHDHKKRWRDHRNDLKGKKHSNAHLQNWFNKYRVLPLFIVLQECLPGMMDACEVEWIAKFRTKGFRLCNSTSGGEGGEWTEENKRQQSERCAEKNRELAKNPKWIEARQIVVATSRGMTLEEYRKHKAEQHEKRKLGVEIHKRSMAKFAERKAKRELFQTLTPLTHKGNAFVPLTQGQWQQVPADAWPRVSQHSWHASYGKNCQGKASINGRKVLLSTFAKRLAAT
jgi:transposase